jgi:LysR family transcriptional regulator, cyn operon transcriptional activator
MLIPSVRYLKAVADYGSFTRAAAALHVSQPALSQQIRELEGRMGAQLLDRSGRTVRPTDVGEAYLRHVRRALDELEVGGRAIRDVQDLSSGALRLGFTPSFAIYLLGPLIRRYRDRFPGIVLTITEMAQEEMERAVSTDVVDVGLAFSDVLAQDVEWLPLHAERLSLIVGQEHPAATGDREMDTAALAAESLALLGPTFATRVTVDRYLRRHGVQPLVAVEANSIAAIVEIVRVARLATILPESVAQEQAGLSVVRLTPAIGSRRVALLQRRGGYRSAASRAFVTVAKDYTKAIEGRGRRREHRVG